MKLLYYAHSKRTYGTRKEKRELKSIKRQFPDHTIINPAELDFINMYEEDIMNECKSIVRQVNTVVVSEYCNHIGRGVYEELTEKTRARKFLLRKKQFIENFFVRMVDKNDQRVRYAECVEEI